MLPLLVLLLLLLPLLLPLVLVLQKLLVLRKRWSRGRSGHQRAIDPHKRAAERSRRVPDTAYRYGGQHVRRCALRRRETMHHRLELRRRWCWQRLLRRGRRCKLSAVPAALRFGLLGI